jgi:hypothetical protein
MKTTILYSILLTALLSLAGCEKDSETADNSCSLVSAGLAANDAQEAGRGINKLITKLPSAEYSGANLDLLAGKMSGDCGISTTVTCLNCNHAIPLESELTATFTIGGVEKQKIIVISQSPDNKMVFQSMRD